MTKERIQQFRDGVAAMTGNERDEVCALAIAHLDSARARRVGEAVIEACGAITIETLERTLRNEYEGTGTGVFPRVLMGVIVKALRGEP